MSDTAVTRVRVSRVTGITVIVLLCGVCLLLAFRGGAYASFSWLLVLLAVAALALLLAVSGPPVSAGRGQKILLGLFAAQAAWTSLSMLWAESSANAWEEINRTFLYLLGATLVFVAVRWAGPVALRLLALLLVAAITVMALVVVLRLAFAATPADLFVGGRLNYPVTYFNGLASLLMIGFWLALGLASGSRAGARNPRGADGDPSAGTTLASAAPEVRMRWFPAWGQCLLLSVSVFLLQLALLPQSRGALWTFFLVVPVFVILSPHRLRALVNLGIVTLPTVVFWGRLNGVYAAFRDGSGVDDAISGVLAVFGYSLLMVFVLWAVSWTVERGVGTLSRRVAVWLGIVLVALAVVAAAVGLIYADQRVDGLGGYMEERWDELVADRYDTPTDSGSRFGAFGLNGRLTQWKIAARAFADHPLLGLGAQNFELYYNQHRQMLLDVRQPHSQPMQLLAELGLPGLLLWIAFVVATVAWAALVRFRVRDRALQAIMAALMTAAISWFIHSSADWLWQLAAVSLPALMLSGGLAGAGAGRSGPGMEEGRRWPWRYARPVLVVLILAVLASAALPYLSLRYAVAAAGAATRDLESALAAAETAAALDPTSTFPLSVTASIYTTSAASAPQGSATQIAYLRLAAEAFARAAEIEPAGWVVHYQAAEAYLAARDAALDGGDASSAALFSASAQRYLDEAYRLNPLSPRVDELQQKLWDWEDRTNTLFDKERKYGYLLRMCAITSRSGI